MTDRTRVALRFAGQTRRAGANPPRLPATRFFMGAAPLSPPPGGRRMRAISGRQLDRHSPDHEIGFTRAPDQTGGVAGSASPNRVAGPRNGVDQPALEAVVDLLAQTVDVHIDDVAARLG